ncbi:mucin-binding protein [Limosilactobacillus sp.]|uniref:mucin-binding protein n=1 Tax=Limosilactobacillus sp. TaxID=2773925 RepID=UPI003F0D1D41
MAWKSKQSQEQLPHYGLRKLSIGVASVLLSTSFYLGLSADTGHAATVPANGEVTQAQASDQSLGNGAQQPAASESSSPVQVAPAEQATSTVPTAQTAINDQVGDSNNQIEISNHQVVEASGDQQTGTPGTTTLDLGLDIPSNQAAQLKAGDYLDIKLGLPYQTNDGQSWVMSYGVINNQAQPLAVTGNGVTAAYIVPVGQLDGYQQTIGQNGRLVSTKNSNGDADSLGTSNGYYRLIFTDGIKDYLASHAGTTGTWHFDFSLVWYNGSSYQDKKSNAPAPFTLYTSTGNAGTYTPNDDLQVGDKKFASGLQFTVQKIDSGQANVKVTDKPIASNHTGNMPAHEWFTANGQEYLIPHDETQSVGLSLANKDQNNHQLGQQFTITVTKPANNADVSFDFVTAADVQRQLQDLIVPEDNRSQLVDQVTGTGDYYLSNPSLYQQPKVTVTANYSNNGNTVTYTVNVDQAYKGFRVTYNNTAPFTLINWRTADPTALLPPDSITDFAKDQANVTYQGDNDRQNWFSGYPIQNQAVRNYLNSHPWHVAVANDAGYNYTTDYGYWIDASSDNRPTNNGYIANHFYGWVSQTIHFVDENGQPMKDDNGQPVSDLVRTVSFVSGGDQNDFAGQTQAFTDVDVHRDGYTAFVGEKDQNGQLVLVNGKAVTSSKLTGDSESHEVYGHEDAFGFPHDNFVEYVVYKKDQPTPQPEEGSVTIHYMDEGVNPSATTFTPQDGTELTAQQQSRTGEVGDRYTNTLWDYRQAGYELATATADSAATAGNFTAGHQDVYIYLKHRVQVETENFTATENIKYVYANGEHAGETAAPDYNHVINYSRERSIDLTNNQVLNDWSAWQADGNFGNVQSPIISNYQADQSLVAAPQLSAADFVNGATKHFEFVVNYTTNPQPDPQPTDPQPTDPQPTDPQPTDPQPTDPQPTNPQPTDPQPTDPQPTDPQPTDPQPTDPQPTDPQPTDPQPTDPQPTDPQPTDPQPTSPTTPVAPTSPTDPVTPSTPTTPANPTTPEVPTQPATPSQPGDPVRPALPEESNKTVATAQATKLPQTGTANQYGLLALGLAALAALFGLARRRPKNN